MVVVCGTSEPESVDLQQLRSKLAAAEGERSELRQQLTERDSVSAAQSNLLPSLRSELAEQKKLIVDLQSQLIDMSEANAALTKQLDQSKLELLEMTHQRDEYQQRLTSVNSNALKLAAKNQEFSDLAHQLTKERDDAMKENSKLHKSNEESVEFLGLQMSELKTANNKLEHDMTALEEETASLKTQLQLKTTQYVGCR